MHTLELSSGPAAYIDDGDGSTVLLLHGAPMTAIGFARVIDRLARHHRVIAPDLPGFGNSAANARFSGSLRAYADFVHDPCVPHARGRRGRR